MEIKQVSFSLQQSTIPVNETLVHFAKVSQRTAITQNTNR